MNVWTAHRDEPLCVGMVGSRHLNGWRFEQFRTVAEILTLAGMRVISGGADGADQAAYLGAVKAWRSDPQHLQQPRLHLDVGLHTRAYPGAMEIYHEKATDELRHLAAKHAFPGQIGSKWWGYFVRNAHIASECDVLLAWRTSDSRGTEHTMRVALALGRKVLAFDVSYAEQPWASIDELINRMQPHLQYARR